VTAFPGCLTGQQRLPTLFIIGDSTVRNSANGLLGWGDPIATFFDQTRIKVDNRARGGRSSRTYITEGLWDQVLVELKPGDFVIMQFGHNDSGPLDDTARARGTIKGTGDDSTSIYNPIRKMNEVVHTYGWYIQKIVSDAKSKGAIPIICSPIPRNDWKNGKVPRNNTSYGLWAKQIAEKEKVIHQKILKHIFAQFC